MCHSSQSSETVDPKCLLCFELRKNSDLAWEVAGQLDSHGREKAGEGEDKSMVAPQGDVWLPQ